MQMPGFRPPWLWAWFNLHARKTLLKSIFDVFIAWLIMISSYIFDSSEKAATKAINKPTAMHLQSKCTQCVSAV